MYQLPNSHQALNWNQILCTIRKMSDHLWFHQRLLVLYLCFSLHFSLNCFCLVYIYFVSLKTFFLCLTCIIFRGIFDLSLYEAFSIYVATVCCYVHLQMSEAETFISRSKSLLSSCNSLWEQWRRKKIRIQFSHDIINR